MQEILLILLVHCTFLCQCLDLSNMSARNLMTTQGNYCFTPQTTNPYPQILGGNNGSTEFLSIFYDLTNSRLLIGGTSQSQDIV